MLLIVNGEFPVLVSVVDESALDAPTSVSGKEMLVGLNEI
jgi:hypothetical protein